LTALKRAAKKGLLQSYARSGLAVSDPVQQYPTAASASALNSCNIVKDSKIPRFLEYTVAITQLLSSTQASHLVLSHNGTVQEPDISTVPTTYHGTADGLCSILTFKHPWLTLIFALQTLWRPQDVWWQW
jgi:hypothetical protein